MLPKYSDYVKHCDGETKWINFLIKDDDLLKKYISNKVSNSIKKELDCKLIFKKHFLKTKRRSYGLTMRILTCNPNVLFIQKKFLKKFNNQGFKKFLNQRSK